MIITASKSILFVIYTLNNSKAPVFLVYPLPVTVGLTNYIVKKYP